MTAKEYFQCGVLTSDVTKQTDGFDGHLTVDMQNSSVLIGSPKYLTKSGSIMKLGLSAYVVYGATSLVP